MTARFLLFWILSSALLTGALRASDAEDKRFHELLDRIWRWNMEQSPEWATYLGRREGLDRWTDLSLEAIEQRKKQMQEFLRELESLNPAQLSESNRLDYALLLRDFKNSVKGQQFPGEYLVLNQLGGAHQEIAELMQVVPAKQPEDFEAILARFKSFPQYVDQNITLLKEGLEKGITPPRVTLRDVPEQIQKLIAEDSLENPILAPFRKESPYLSAEDQEKYREEGLKAFRREVLPALKKFHAFVRDTYLPGARESIAMSALPQGEAWYAHAVANSTTTDMTPKQIHELGLQEVARIRGEMEKVMREAKFEGTLQEFVEFLRTDDQFYYTDSEDLLAGYRNICKQADAQLPAFFGKLPRLTYGVLPVPDYAASSKPTAYYQSGSPEAGRPGYFYANTYDLKTRPKWEMEALALHEAVPGHHLQVALAQEIEGKHEMLRERFYTAYVEGWGLYSERLGKEMGFYKDPYSDFGRLTYEMWRAVRLVVDTGIHALGWTREQAIDYFRENTAKNDHDITVEVDRYIVWPGQALAYKIGEIKLHELRHRAETALGKKFDIRQFHDLVLDEGAIPLDVLEQRVEEWIARQKEST